MCPTDFPAKGQITETMDGSPDPLVDRTEAWIRFQTRDFLRELKLLFPRLECSISLSWVDLERTSAERTNSSAVAGQASQST